MAYTWHPVHGEDAIVFFEDGTTSGATQKLVDKYVSRMGVDTISFILRSLWRAEEANKSPGDFMTEDQLLATVYASPDAKITVTKFEYDNAKANYYLHRDMHDDEEGNWCKTVLSARQKRNLGK